MYAQRHHSRRVFCVLVALVVAFAACSAPPRGDESGGGASPPSGPGAGGSGAGGSAVDPAAPFFDVPSATSLVRIDISLPPSSIDALGVAPMEYVEGHVVVQVGAQVIDLPAVGVRLKGKHSFRDLAGKAAFLLDFDKYVDEQSLLGLGKIALDNMVHDPSMLHERLGYRLFRELGVPAPRAGYANVYVNGELYGLYATIESTDNRALLDRWFGDHTCSLYEGQYGGDLVAGLEATFDQDNGEDVGFADLTELVLALDGMTNPETFFTDVAKVIDMDEYLRFAAAELFLGHWDGYAWSRNNYFVHRRPDGRWTFLPWGIDQTFAEHLDPFFDGGGRVEQMCLASTPCRLALAEAFEEVITRAEAIGLSAEASSLEAILWGAIVADPRKEVEPAAASDAMAETLAFLSSRPGSLKHRLGCADPSFVLDVDQDGSNGCKADCDDGDPVVHAGAPEACNLADENCNGLLDDDPACPQCVIAPMPAGGGTIAACFHPETWADAEADCVAQGGHLASIHDAEAQEFVSATALAIPGGNWWIGLTDEAAEGTFVWTDGTPLGFSAWSKNEPSKTIEENCVHLTGWADGAWNDIACDNVFPYVCRLP
jgi:hypothetical protein